MSTVPRLRNPVENRPLFYDEGDELTDINLCGDFQSFVFVILSGAQIVPSLAIVKPLQFGFQVLSLLLRSF